MMATEEGTKSNERQELQQQTLLALAVFKEGEAAKAALQGATCPKEIARLKRKVRQGERAIAEVVTLHEGFVGWVFEKHFKSSFWLKEELIHEGKSALYSAALTYDPAEGTSFITWAFGYIRSAMLAVEGVSAHAVTLGRNGQARYRQIQAVRRRLEGEGYGTDEVTPLDIAQEEGLPLEQVEAMWNLGSPSLDAEITDDGLTLLEVVAYDGDEQLTAYVTPTTQEEVLVAALLGTLKADDAKLIEEVVMNEVPVTQMAERLGVSKQAVSQKVKRLLKKLTEAGQALSRASELQ